MTRLEKELELVRRRFPDAVLSPQRDWLEIPEYGLPPGYNRAAVRLRIAITPAYPDTPPDNFYVQPAVSLKAGTLGNYSQVQMWGESWGQFSWHYKDGWRPHADVEKGDNLLSYLDSVRARLEELS